MTSTERAEGKGARWTREAWLEAATDEFRTRFIEVGLPLPERVHVSVGFSAGSRAENRQILGSTWKRKASADGVNHVFISPEIATPTKVLETLLHELIHVADDVESGHRGRFAEVAVRFGFDGPMTSTPAGIALTAELMTIADALGDYPHGKLTIPVRASRGAAAPVGASGKVTSGPAPQANRYIKVICMNDVCVGFNGYTVRLVRKWLDVGLPGCGICGMPMDES
jgi:hypothetical protein